MFVVVADIARVRDVWRLLARKGERQKLVCLLVHSQFCLVTILPFKNSRVKNFVQLLGEDELKFLNHFAVLVKIDSQFACSKAAETFLQNGRYSVMV